MFIPICYPFVAIIEDQYIGKNVGVILFSVIVIVWNNLCQDIHCYINYQVSHKCYFTFPYKIY